MGVVTMTRQRGMVVVTNQQAGAFRRFRTSADAKLIKEVLLQELMLTREQYESEEANEETRLEIKAAKRAIDVLFKDELIKE